MKAVTLLYHDIVREGDYLSSGFQSSDADFYKLERREFIEHLDAIKQKHGYKAQDLESLHSNRLDGIPFYISFDDGGKSFLTEIAGILEDRGWVGIFFISTDFLNTPGFLTDNELIQLRKRGHVIGSHSCSHPKRISNLSFDELITEWGDSKAKLENILGEPVTTASVPGGFLSKDIERSAASVGYKSLFTSEPQKAIYSTDECLIVGRYSIAQGVTSKQAVQLASKEATFTQTYQFIYWNLKKVAKTYFSTLYAYLRLRLLKPKV